MNAEHTHSHNCACPSQYSSVVQTLDELDFERGIWAAAVDGITGKMENLLHKGTPVDIHDNLGYTALHYAARHNRDEVCKLLLAWGASVNALTRGGQTPLHRAAGSGHGHIVDILLKAQADTTIKDSDGKTALHKSAENNHMSICVALLQANPAVTKIKDGQNKTAAQYTATSELIALLTI